MPFTSLSFGGSSGALLTLLTAVLPKLHPHRDVVLFDDICHQSAIGGLIFGRWKAVRLIRSIHPKHQTVQPLKLETIKDTVEKYGAARIAALILVLPSYDGFRSPSEDRKIYEFANIHGISVIIDGAWDAMRLGFRSSSVSFVDIMIAEHRLNQILSGQWDKAFAQAETAANLLRAKITYIHPDIRCVQAEDLGADAQSSATKNTRSDRRALNGP